MSFIALRGRGPCTVIVFALAVTLALTPAMPASADPTCPHGSYRLPPGTPGGITLEISPICISPDGNRLADTVTIHGTTGGGALDWTVIVANGAGEVVDKIMRNGADATLVWDGRNTAGQRVAEGTYTMQVQLECEQVASTPVPTVPHVPPVPWSELSDGISFTCGDAEPIPAGDSVNYLLASTTITVDLTAPAIQGFTVSNPAFSPNGDGVKDSTAFSATLDDANASWTLNVVSPLNAALRSFEGTGATVAATWDGTDGNGAAVAEGTYRAILTATDAAQNSRTDVIGVINDITQPVVSAMSHPDASNTLMLRPTLGATISDTSAGIDGGASQLRLGATVLSTFGESVVGSTGTRSATGQPATALTLDEDQHWSVQAKDMAGNTTTEERLFRVVNVHQEPLSASIPPVTATVPDCSDPVLTAQGCKVTFKDVRVNLGSYAIQISSTMHAGIGTFTREVSLGSASVSWPTSAGGVSTNPGLARTTASTDLTLDDSMNGPFAIPVGQESVNAGDVVVSVPSGVTEGATATLAMNPVTVPAPCADTSVAQDPASCGGPSNSIVEPLPLEYSFEHVDPDVTEPVRPIEEIIAEQDAVLPPDDGIPPALIDPAEMETNSLPPSGDISALHFGLGAIEIQVAEGVDPIAVAADHGGLPADLTPSLEAPFTQPQKDVGLDRWYRLTVVPGSEKTKLTEYAADSRVEYAQLDAVAAGTIGACCDPYPNDPGAWDTMNEDVPWQGKQWNLSVGPARDGWRRNGVSAPGAWGITHGETFNGLKVDTAIIDTGFRLDHEDLAAKVDESTTFMPAGTDLSQCGDLNRHGTWIAGINAVTDNHPDVPGSIAGGVAGVNWGGKIVPIQVGVAWSSAGCRFVENQRADWINTASREHSDPQARARVAVINESLMFKGGVENSPSDKKECDAIKAAYFSGIVVVTAAPYGYKRSETDEDPTYKAIWPSKCNYTLGTTATKTNGRILDKALAFRYLADVAAPGVKIWSTDNYAPGQDKYVHVPFEGTSVAAPHAAGLAALLQGMGAPVYSSLWTPQWSATPIYPDSEGKGRCDGRGDAPTCRGRINMTRAVMSTLPNGVFSPWVTTGGFRPHGWTFGGQCSTDSSIHRGSDASYEGGGSAAVMRCRGRNSIYLTPRVAVQSGYRYRATARVRRSNDNDIATSAWMRVCFYKNDPFGPSAAEPEPPCTSERSDGSVLTTDWNHWKVDTDRAATDTQNFATVTVRAYSTGDGWIAWDDVGLSALPPPMPS